MEANTSNIQLLKFDTVNNKWSLADTSESHQELPAEYKILSWNILFDKYEEDKNPIYYFRNRLPYILDKISEIDADIVALQEVTSTMLSAMLQEMIKYNSLHDYYVTPANCKNYGQLILTKYKPIAQNLIDLNGKNYISVTMSDHMKNNIEICNVHLTSDMQKDAMSKRKAQMKKILSNMANNSKYIIVGDFNATDDEFDDKFFKDEIDDKINDEISGYIMDAWTRANNRESCEYTFDPTKNKLAELSASTLKPFRLDRLYIRNGEAKIIDFQLVATEPIDDQIWLSDHYGILVQIQNI